MEYTTVYKELTEGEKANLQALKVKKYKMGKGLKWSIIALIVFVLASAMFGQERVATIDEYEEYDGNNSLGSYAYVTVTGSDYTFGVENTKTGEVYYNATVDGNKLTLCVPKATVNSLDSYDDKATLYGKVERTLNDVTRKNSSLNDKCLRVTSEIPQEAAQGTDVGQEILMLAISVLGILSCIGIFTFSIACIVLKRKIKKIEN